MVGECEGGVADDGGLVVGFDDGNDVIVLVGGVLVGVGLLGAFDDGLGCVVVSSLVGVVVVGAVSVLLDEGILVGVDCSILIPMLLTRALPSLMIRLSSCPPLRGDAEIDVGNDKMPTSPCRMPPLLLSFGGVEGATTPITSCTSCSTDENSSSALESDARMKAAVAASNKIDTVPFENRMVACY